jgi:TPR repeat protein
LEHGLYGLRVNYAQAYIHYTEAAKKGDARAMLGLSRLYNKGSHGSTDSDKASYKRRVAEDESGWLVQWDPDEELAFSWCRNAADQGLAEAEILLG